MKWQRLIACGVIMVACCGALTAQTTDGLVLKVSLDKAVYEPGEAITLSLEAHNEGPQWINVTPNGMGYQLVLDGKHYRFNPQDVLPMPAGVIRRPVDGPTFREGKIYGANPQEIQPASDKVVQNPVNRPIPRQFAFSPKRLEPGQEPFTMTLPLSGTTWLELHNEAWSNEALVMRPGDHVAYLATVSMAMPMGMPMRSPQGRGPGMLREIPSMGMTRIPRVPRELPAEPMPQDSGMPRALSAEPSAVSEPVFFKIVGDASVMQSLYYGRVVFEDGSPAAVPALSLKPSIYMGPPEGGTATYMAEVEDDGTFVVGLAPQEVTQINQGILSLSAIFTRSVRQASLLSKESSPIALGSLGKLISEPGEVRVARPPVYYGRILYEDGTVPTPPAGPNWIFGCSVGAPMSSVPGKPGLDEAGYFAMFVSAEQRARLTSRNLGYPIYNGPPTPDANGSRTRVPVAEFPLELLSLDKAKAGVVKIPKLEAGE